MNTTWQGTTNGYYNGTAVPLFDKKWSHSMVNPEDIFSSKEAIVVGTIIAIMTLFGIVANSVTFLTICNTKSLRKSPFNLIIMSLCVSDFLSAISCPFTTYGLYASLRKYPFPSVICKLHTAIDFWTNAVTIQHILAFSVMRLISIVWPHKIKRFTHFYAKMTVGIMWMETAVVSFLPYFVFMGVYPGWFVGSLSCQPKNEWIMIFVQYVKYAYPVILYLPMAAVSICTVILVVLMVVRKYKKVTGKRKKRNSKEFFAILQLSLILFSFLIGYVPDVVRRLYNTRNSLLSRPGFLFYIIPITTLRLSECLNPVFYNIASSSIREATKKYLCSSCKSLKRNNDDNVAKRSAVTKQTNDVPLQSIPTT